MRVSSEQVIGTPDDTGSDLSMLLSQFIQDVGYKGAPNSYDKALFEAMVKRAGQIGIPITPNSKSWHLFKYEYTYPCVCFPDFPLDVKVYVGLYSWIGLFIDDEGHTKEVEEFQRRFTAGEEQPTLVLRAWADIINECYSYYDPLSANLIVTSSLYFTTMTNLDHRKEFQGRLPAKHAQDYPLYIRDRSGIGEAFALFTFPKAQFPDLSKYLEAVPNMIAYIGFTNYILSFYKEEKAGEMDNYVRTMSMYESKEPILVLKDLATKVFVALDRIRSIMNGKAEYANACDKHEKGYVAFHTLSRRYKLYEIGLGEEFVGDELDWTFSRK
ncbi:hypothetical protein SCUP234_12993 [Seiridium cupressi]